MPRPKLSLTAAFLWIEAIAMAGFSFMGGQGWLLPLATVVALFAALLSKGLGTSLCATAAAAGYWISVGRLVLPVFSLPVSFAVVAILSGVVVAFLGIVEQAGMNEEGSLRGRWLKLVTLLHFMVAGLLLADQRQLLSAPVAVGWMGTILGLVLTLDIITASFAKLFTPPGNHHALRPPGAFRFFQWLGPEWRDCLPRQAIPSDDALPGISEMWLWPLIKSRGPLIILAGLLFTWAMTCVHEVSAGQQGIRTRLGCFESAVLPPGLHVSLPWPFGGVRSVATDQMHELVLGFGSDPGKPILWERPHYIDEELSLVGGGDDFLSISVPILYRISNPHAYLLSAANPDLLLRDLAKRSLLQLTLNRTAADIMTDSRESLRKAMQRELQAELDRRNAGLLVCDVYFRDIHPPVAVAPAFQEVVSAIEEKEAVIHGGEEYRLEQLPVAQGDAKRVLLEAEAKRDGRLAKVSGDVSRFSSLGKARAEAPGMYDLREGFRTFDSTLAGAKKAIFDEKFHGQIPAHLDLRRVLNPKLIDHSAPSAEPLVPDPDRTADTFDPSVEGYH